MALVEYQYIQKQTIDNKTIKVFVPEELEERKIKEATSLVDEKLFKGSIAGDILVYEVYDDGHPEDVYGEYTVIPCEMTDYIELQKDNAIAICIGDGVFVSLDEEDQPWAGDVYTGLYNTNFAWQSTINEVVTLSTNVETKPWLSENNGNKNTDKILWAIYDDMYNDVEEIYIWYARNNLYKAVYDKLVEANRYAWSEDPNNIIKWHSETGFILLKEAYKAFIYEAIEEGDYGIDKEHLDYIFEMYHQENTNKKYVDNESLLWKETIQDNNYYINHNGEQIPITVEYEYSKVDASMLGELYTSKNMVYDPVTSLPVYSRSTNAFVYAQQYSTRGTEPGQWYLGSKQEMQNLMNYETIVKVNEMLKLLGRTLIDIHEAPNYLTSSQAWYNTNYCYTIYTHYRYVTALDKRVVSHVRLVLNPAYVNKIEETE